MRKLFILSLALSGCCTPSINRWGHAPIGSDVALIKHWTDELEKGDITLDEFKFLVIGRVEDMR